MTHILTLVGNREEAALTSAVIGLAQDAGEGKAARVLSPGEAVAIPCSPAPDITRVRAALAGTVVDVIVTPAQGQRKRLLIADMDSTIIQGETLDDLAAQAGLGETISVITARAMNGELDFKAALRERVAMLRGLPASLLDKTWAGVRLTPGARQLVATMRAHGAYTALVSGGFTFFTSRVAALVGFDLHRSNTLLIRDGRLTGHVAEPILDRAAKLETLRELMKKQGLTAGEALATGDGANDLDMIGAAGLGVAFHAKPIVAAAAGARVDHADLRALLFAQGYPASAFVGAD